MRLNICPTRLISDVQKEFNQLFPFLKLEFFRNRIYQQPDFSLENQLPHNRKVALAQTDIIDGDLEIKPGMTVKELETMFRTQFSLAVQVFRRSGNIWLETTMTDNWTLEHQNEHGRELSLGKVNNTGKQEDFDLGREPGQ